MRVKLLPVQASICMGQGVKAFSFTVAHVLLAVQGNAVP